MCNTNLKSTMETLMTNTTETHTEAEHQQRKVQKYHIQNAAKLPTLEDRKPLVDGFLYNTDTMFLFAPAGGYKSMVAINLAVAVASGGKFMGKQAYQGRVLFIDGELSQYSFQQRLGLFGTSEHLEILSECYQSPRALPSLKPIHIEDQSRWQPSLLTLAERNDYSLIVLDNVRTLTDGINENDSAEISPMNTFVKRLRHQGCAVLVVHHTRKGEGNEGESVYAGSTNFLTVYNTCIGIEPVGVDGIRFNVIKDREHSVDDSFREGNWRLSDIPGEGFVAFDGFSAEAAQMRALMDAVRGGEFSTKAALIRAARSRFGIKFSTKSGELRGLHNKLAEEDIVPTKFEDFDEIVKDSIATANGKEDF